MRFAGNMIGASRLRTNGWAILQTALAAGMAWYLTRDALGHTAPFFAPIAASVCMWATNVVRAQRAIEMVVGVGLGIGLGSGVHILLGDGPVAMAVVVLVALSMALVIGRGFLLQRPMFVNQTVISAILVLAFPHGGIGTERLFDALIGGSIAVVFSIVLFPKNPPAVLRESVDAAIGELAAAASALTHDEDTPAAARGISAQSHRGVGAQQIGVAGFRHRHLHRRTGPGHQPRAAMTSWWIR
jgi:uncharacterized membrane protein YgaE (UPF0421/DUF939 family)